MLPSVALPRIAARVLPFLAGTVLLAATAYSHAQPYPNRPVKFMVGYGAGGGVDITARHLAESLREGLGQTILIENRAGAAGMVAANAVAKAAPDGYTLLMAASGEIATNPHLYNQKMQYDAEKDFIPITNVVMMPNVPPVSDTPAMAGFQLVNWYGLFAPAATPADVVTKLNVEVTKVLRNPAFVEKMRSLGGEANPMTPQQFREFVIAESASFKRIIERANVKLPE